MAVDKLSDNRLYKMISSTQQNTAVGQLLLCSGLLAIVFVIPYAHGQSVADLDSDGVADVVDIDQDNDGIINTLEGVVRIVDLSDSPAHYFAANPVDDTLRASSFNYDLVSLDNGRSATLVATLLSTDTEVEWSMHNALPKLRNLGAGSSVVQWSLVGEAAVSNFDLTISDLDGLRSETISLSESSIVGYSLALNSNVVVQRDNGQLIFTGKGLGGDSVDDLVTLHFRDSTDIVLGYSNAFSGADGDKLIGELATAGYRHSLERQSSTYFTPVTQNRDSDGDGVADHRDLDSDNDGLGDVVESGGVDADYDNLSDGVVDDHGLSINVVPGLSAESVSLAYLPDITVTGDDADGDGLLSSVDSMPEEFGGALSDSDEDSDGLSDLEEVRVYFTMPDQADSDNDGLGDGVEVTLHDTDPLQNDTDRDGLTDGDEVNQYGTRPKNVDSDGDGISDGDEIQNATNPLVSDRVIVVLPDPVIADPTPEEQVIDDLITDVAVLVRTDPVEAAVESDNPMDDTTTLLAEDPVQANEVSLRTGLGGIAGCSVAKISTSSALSLPMMLVLAIAGLANSTRRRNFRA